MQSRHNAVLQMYGEKAEEAEELKMDLIDIKNMYKQQVYCSLVVRPFYVELARVILLCRINLTANYMFKTLERV